MRLMIVALFLCSFGKAANSQHVKASAFDKVARISCYADGEPYLIVPKDLMWKSETAKNLRHWQEHLREAFLSPNGCENWVNNFIVGHLSLLDEGRALCSEHAEGYDSLSSGAINTILKGRGISFNCSDSVLDEIRYDRSRGVIAQFRPICMEGAASCWFYRPGFGVSKPPF